MTTSDVQEPKAAPVCSICGRSFSTAEELLNHQQTAHAEADHSRIDDPLTNPDPTAEPERKIA
jgi:hypothetical protein